MFTFSAFVVTEIFRSLCCILQSLRIAECAIYKHVHNSNMLVYCCCVMFANKPYAYFILHYVLLCIIYVTNYISHFQDDCTYCNMDCMRYLQMQYTHLAYTLCILWDCCTNCNQLGSVWSQSLLLKHCQHIAHIFQANVLPMFRMQYFCNNVIFATPICNTFLSNKDIWSRIRFEISVVQVLTSQGSCASLPFFFNIRPGLDISESFLHWKISGNVKMIDSMFITTSLNHGGKWGTSVLLLLNVLRF